MDDKSSQEVSAEIRPKRKRDLSGPSQFCDPAPDHAVVREDVPLDSTVSNEDLVLTFSARLHGRNIVVANYPEQKVLVHGGNVPEHCLAGLILTTNTLQHMVQQVTLNYRRFQEKLCPHTPETHPERSLSQIKNSFAPTLEAELVVRPSTASEVHIDHET